MLNYVSLRSPLQLSGHPYNTEPLRKRSFENMVGKRQAFSAFSAMFSTLSKTIFAILSTYKLLSANALNLEKFIILSFGKELNITQASYPVMMDLQPTKS